MSITFLGSENPVRWSIDRICVHPQTDSYGNGFLIYFLTYPKQGLIKNTLNDESGLADLH
jgi:hypothetical protein